MEILAPGKRDLVAFLEAYFDESYSDKGDRVFAVAGYLFEKDAVRELDLKWKETLFSYKDLPYFHMVDCAHHNKPFDRLSEPECDAIAREMIGLIRAHATLGVAGGICRQDYDDLFHENGWRPMGDAYTYCCWNALGAIHAWITRNQFDGEVAYFFEAGHASQPKANALMMQIFDNENLRGEFRYAGHAFRDKRCLRPLQTADILAWHHFSDIKKILAGKPRRKDFAALIEDRQVDLRFIARQFLHNMKYQTDDLLEGWPLLTGTYGNFSTFVATWIRDRS